MFASEDAGKTKVTAIWHGNAGSFKEDALIELAQQCV